MYALPASAIRMVHDEMFSAGPPPAPTGVLEWKAPGAERFLTTYKRRAYATERVPVLNRSLYVVEYHWGEGSCCTLHPVIHDTPRSLVLSYDDIAVGLVGFEREDHDGRSSLLVRQIQGTQYRTGHSGRETGAEGPARSISWQPALLHAVVAVAALEGVDDVAVLSHVKSPYRKIRNDWFGNARRMYDGTAEACGFTHDVARGCWVRPAAPDAAAATAAAPTGASEHRRQSVQH